MDLNKEFFACLALRHTSRLGPRTWKRILEAYQSAYEAVRCAADWPTRKLANRSLAEAVTSEVWRADAEVEYRSTRMRRLDVVTWFDPRYPQRLREIADPPLLLYASGDASLLSAPSVAVVGARKSTEHGLATARRISEELSRMGLSVVSGLALGIDREAHLGGLVGVGSSVGVLGCGLDVNYPKGNADVRAELERRGCVVSEFAPGTPPDGNNFPHRNRIISGISLAVVVAEAAERSGSLITARLAMEQGRDVFALPGPAGQAAFTGCHRLIREGATLAESGEDILAELRFQFGPELTGLRNGQAPRRTSGLTSKVVSHVDQAVIPSVARLSPPDDPEERAVFDLLDKEGQAHIDSLTRALDWESFRVSRVLLVLEMKGLVRQCPGMRYSLVVF
ncbi:MAG: DNA-processing protein DprA [Desulfovibrionaceae bacterium]